SLIYYGKCVALYIFFGIGTQHIMQKEIELAIAPDYIRDAQYIKYLGAKKLQVASKRISGFHIRKRSIDVRSKQVLYRVRVIFFIDEDVNVEVFSSSLQNVSRSEEHTSELQSREKLVCRLLL